MSNIIGVNFEQLVDYSPEQPFSDIMKQSRDWQLIGSGSALNLDSNGWVKSLGPNQHAQTLMYWNMQKNLHYPAGNYIVNYQGSGTLRYQQSNGFVNIVSSRPGQDIITLDPAHGGFMLGIFQTNPANYIKNIQVLIPNVGTSHWNQSFIDSIKNYNTLRFMWHMHATINAPSPYNFQ